MCTVLWRRTCPLIRYSLGDTAEWAEEPCSCGSPYPLLKRLTGRITEMIELPSGERVSNLALRTPVISKPGVEQYQLVQETPSTFRLHIVAGTEFTPLVERTIREEFRQRFGPSLELRVVKVPRIKTPPGVKVTPMVTLDQIRKLKSSGVNTAAYVEDAKN